MGSSFRCSTGVVAAAVTWLAVMIRSRSAMLRRASSFETLKSWVSGGALHISAEAPNRERITIDNDLWRVATRLSITPTLLIRWLLWVVTAASVLATLGDWGRCFAFFVFLSQSTPYFRVHQTLLLVNSSECLSTWPYGGDN